MEDLKVAQQGGVVQKLESFQNFQQNSKVLQQIQQKMCQIYYEIEHGEEICKYQLCDQSVKEKQLVKAMYQNQSLYDKDSKERFLYNKQLESGVQDQLVEAWQKWGRDIQSLDEQIKEIKILDLQEELDFQRGELCQAFKGSVLSTQLELVQVTNSLMGLFRFYKEKERYFEKKKEEKEFLRIQKLKSGPRKNVSKMQSLQNRLDQEVQSKQRMQNFQSKQKFYKTDFEQKMDQFLKVKKELKIGFSPAKDNFQAPASPKNSFKSMSFLEQMKENQEAEEKKEEEQQMEGKRTKRRLHEKEEKQIEEEARMKREQESQKLKIQKMENMKIKLGIMSIKEKKQRLLDQNIEKINLKIKKQNLIQTQRSPSEVKKDPEIGEEQEEEQLNSFNRPQFKSFVQRVPLESLSFSKNMEFLQKKQLQKSKSTDFLIKNQQMIKKFSKNEGFFKIFNEVQKIQPQKDFFPSQHNNLEEASNASFLHKNNLISPNSFYESSKNPPLSLRNSLHQSNFDSTKNQFAPTSRIDQFSKTYSNKFYNSQIFGNSNYHENSTFLFAKNNLQTSRILKNKIKQQTEIINNIHLNNIQDKIKYNFASKIRFPDTQAMMEGRNLQVQPYEEEIEKNIQMECQQQAEKSKLRDQSYLFKIKSLSFKNQ